MRSSAAARRAKEVLPGYPADDGPLSAAELARIRRLARSRLPKGKLVRVKSLSQGIEPAAAIVEIGRVDRMRAMQARFAEISSRIQGAFSGLSDKGFEALIEEAGNRARKVRRGRRASR